MNTITRDDTIHGVEYVTKQEAEREITELNERLIDRQQTLMETLIENQNLRRILMIPTNKLSRACSKCGGE